MQGAVFSPGFSVNDLNVQKQTKITPEFTIQFLSHPARVSLKAARACVREAPCALLACILNLLRRSMTHSKETRGWREGEMRGGGGGRERGEREGIISDTQRAMTLASCQGGGLSPSLRPCLARTRPRYSSMWTRTRQAASYSAHILAACLSCCLPLRASSSLHTHPSVHLFCQDEETHTTWRHTQQKRNSAPKYHNPTTHSAAFHARTRPCTSL